MSPSELDIKAVNTIRFLSADAVQNANSGHPGLPMGTAAMAYVLWTRHLKINPTEPAWPDRDRFVLSAGHGSMLLYSLLHLTGYDLPIAEIHRFRQLESMTPGHPEYGETPGVETTTGPLGQGFANGVGMAIAAEHQAAMYNREGFPIFNHFIYAIVSDGDLMEGVASEAASIAGHLQLGRLIYLYDDNRISIDGSTDLTFTEDRAARFQAYGWHVLNVKDGNNLEEIDRALTKAKADPRPSLIVCRTHIGYGLPTKQDTAAAHGEPPGEEELAGAKERLDWPQEPRFFIPQDVHDHFLEVGIRGKVAYEDWQEMFRRYRQSFPDLAAQFERCQVGRLPEGLDDLPVFPTDLKGMATRASSGTVLNAIAPALPELIGGSADLTGSNKTAITGEVPFTTEDRTGRYIYFGVREHAMGAILSGLALHGGLIPYGGTFLVFSDYLRPAMRLAAMMGQRVIYVFTHDSIGVGEDGPTHQPIEHLAALRTIPNLTVLRPADANEVRVAWQAALERTTGPTALALTRQAVPTLDRDRFASAEGLRKGAYILADLGEGKPQLILIASGSEVSLIIEAGERLVAKSHSVRLVSFPSWELFIEQPIEYRQQVLPSDISARVAIEAGVTQGWERWVGNEGVVIGLDRFGASAPFRQVYQHLGLTVERIIEEAERLLADG
ncbi:MAG: transketolase [Anaerolineaceae bacterium]|nr:MAG: transketolase [Anaerolineaceae bacterium]